MFDCDRCDTCDGKKTYANQACLPINGKVRCIDWCIHQIVAALNAGGVETVASCCGHGTQDGRIDLADGRVLMIAAENMAENKELREKYDDLIYQVATKFPDETRHETARRYIREREDRPSASGVTDHDDQEQG